MPKFRKKAVVIEAHQWFENGNHPEDNPDTLTDSDGKPFLGEGKVVRYYRTPNLDGKARCTQCGLILHDHGWIDTIPGGHIVCPGDWIITDGRVAKAHHGHFYPCKPDIFDATYEPALLGSRNGPAGS